jgi:hypothetical protein
MTGRGGAHKGSNADASCDRWNSYASKIQTALNKIGLTIDSHYRISPNRNIKFPGSLVELSSKDLLTPALLLELNKIVYDDVTWSIVVGIPNFGEDRAERPIKLLIQTNGPGFTTLGAGMKSLIDDVKRLRGE